jgi:DUF971 family protein
MFSWLQREKKKPRAGAAPAPAGETPWPSEIRLVRSQARLEVDFESGEGFTFPAEFLRVESPSAEVQGHGGEEKRIVPGKRGVNITAAEPVGNYAVRLVFDDGHDSGLFTWAYLHELGRNQDRLWKTYLEALEARGLSRQA